MQISYAGAFLNGNIILPFVFNYISTRFMTDENKTKSQNGKYGQVFSCNTTTATSIVKENGRAVKFSNLSLMVSNLNCPKYFIIAAISFQRKGTIIIVELVFYTMLNLYPI